MILNLLFAVKLSAINKLMAITVKTKEMILFFFMVLI